MKVNNDDEKNTIADNKTIKNVKNKQRGYDSISQIKKEKLHLKLPDGNIVKLQK